MEQILYKISFYQAQWSTIKNYSECWNWAGGSLCMISRQPTIHQARIGQPKYICKVRWDKKVSTRRVCGIFHDITFETFCRSSSKKRIAKVHLLWSAGSCLHHCSDQWEHSLWGLLSPVIQSIHIIASVTTSEIVNIKTNTTFYFTAAFSIIDNVNMFTINWQHDQK